MHDVLNVLGKNIQQYLETVLPSCHPDWWDKCVITQLTFQQQRNAGERGWASLADLDLACLLRVLDQNWHQINLVNRLPFEARNWLKEAQSIRNRWSRLKDVIKNWRILGKIAAIISFSNVLFYVEFVYFVDYVAKHGGTMQSANTVATAVQQIGRAHV